MSYGRQVTFVGGYPIQVSSDGKAEMKTGGVTLDWQYVIPVAADTTLGDGTVIPAGGKGLEYGTVIGKITATGLYAPVAKAISATTVASGGTVLGVNTLTLASTTGIFPGDALLIDTAGQAETLIVQSVNGAVVTFTTVTTKTHANGVAVSKPNDGRQPPFVRGEVFILNETVLQRVPMSLAAFPVNHPAAIEGGQVWKDRVKANVGGTAGLPAWSEVEAAMPRIRWLEAQ